MYRVFADDKLIFDSRSDDLVITRGEIEKEINMSGSFSFTIYSDHYLYNQIIKHKTIIQVFKDDVLIFRGRAISDEVGFYKDKTFTCEGELGFLLDSIQRPYSYSGSAENVFTYLINRHNLQVAEDKRFVVGQITIPISYMAVENTNYETTLVNITSKLVDEYGGYLYVTRDVNNNPVLNWFEDFPYMSDQIIEFGENLLDFTQTTDAKEVATAIIPIGKDGLTIAGVKGGLDYITDAQAVERYGLIFSVQEWNEIESASELLTVAQEYLNNLIQQTISIELNAVDLSLLDKSIDSFNLGDYVQIVSVPHDLDVILLISKQTIDLLRPDNDRVTLGHNYATFTDRIINPSGTGTVSGGQYATRDEVNKIENEIKVVIQSITIASGFTQTDGSLKKQGSVVRLSLTVKNASALTAGNSYTIATISEATRPISNVMSLGFTDSTSLFTTTIYPSGEVVVSPESNILANGTLIIKTEWTL